MITRRLFGSALHQHADPARRLEAVETLPPGADELAVLLASDPAAEVRIAAATRGVDLAALIAAWERETDATVRAAIGGALGAALAAAAADEAQVEAFLEADACTDAIRVDVARRATEAQRRRGAIAAIRDEAALVELALGAEHAETRMAAAERVTTADGLRQLAGVAEKKDRGVARLARNRIDAMADRTARAAEADAVIAQLEALAVEAGPILSRVIELDRRWQALALDDDPARLARCEAARVAIQARFDREHEEQRARARFDQRLHAWLAMADSPASAEELERRLGDLAALREEGRQHTDAATLAGLDEAERRVERWTTEFQALAGAEALVVEAEQLAAGTSIDDAKLPERWQALDRGVRTPALTRRFEAALIAVEQRRLAQIRVAEQESRVARQNVHSHLHAAEQALAAGQLQAARAAVDEIRNHKAGAGTLPKPTLQRLSRLTQQLVELERWESFGQHQARIQLCERAEAAATLGGDPPHIAAEVQSLRNEWKALDQQHAGVPKSLWERFDRACEKAYAPAARHFAEQAALRKQARTQREAFIAAAAAHAPTLLAEPRDWRAIERWLRETEHHWRDGDLGSVEPKAWKGFDTRLRAALAPVRDALAAARDDAKARRVALIDEATALAATATERDAPAKVKAIQSRWQAQAKELALPQRDERALWERFRAACDAVFHAREDRRKQAHDAEHEKRRALEELCARLEALAQASTADEPELKRTMRELQEQWRKQARLPDPQLRGLETRFTKAKAAVVAALASRARSREGAMWQALATKELLCDDLDRRLCADGGEPVDATGVNERWAALPALPAPWEKAMLARRDAALAAAGDADAAASYRQRIDRSAAGRREMLLELEMRLGLECPPELQAQRLALQVKHLRERFQGDATAGARSAAERLLAWCAEPGVADAGDRSRCERIVAALASGAGERK